MDRISSVRPHHRTNFNRIEAARTSLPAMAGDINTPPINASHQVREISRAFPEDSNGLTRTELARLQGIVNRWLPASRAALKARDFNAAVKSSLGMLNEFKLIFGQEDFAKQVKLMEALHRYALRQSNPLQLGSASKLFDQAIPFDSLDIDVLRMVSPNILNTRNPDDLLRGIATSYVTALKVMPQDPAGQLKFVAQLESAHMHVMRNNMKSIHLEGIENLERVLGSKLIQTTAA